MPDVDDTSRAYRVAVRAEADSQKRCDCGGVLTNDDIGAPCPDCSEFRDEADAKDAEEAFEEAHAITAQAQDSLVAHANFLLSMAPEQG